jgi:hypothetical protein
VLIHGQMSEGDTVLDDSTRPRSPDLPSPWMTFVVEEDVPFDPGDVSLFGANRIMLKADGFPHLVKELLGALFHWMAPE